MNGLEALEDIVLYLNANEPKGLYLKNIEAIKKELKVNKILKEKKVDLPKIAEWLADNNLKDIKGTTEYYNRYIVNGYMEELTEEEMTAVVELLREE